MLKRAKTVTSMCCFTKRTPRLRPEWLKMLGTNLTWPKTGQKITELAKKPIWPSWLREGIFCHGNILLLVTEYSYSVKRIFCYCWMTCWMTCLMTWLVTGQCGPSVDDVDDDPALTCRITWLSSQTRIPALTGFSGGFPAKLRRALQGLFQLRFRRSLYRRTRMDERNLRSWSKARSENFENSATLNRELKNVFFCV